MKLKVLSLFNGMNCIGLALSELGIKFKLYASEIDKHANKVSNALFPDTINLGDVTKINLEDLPVFDLVVAGSPCQGFSFAGKQLNFEDPRSKLFFNFVDILNHCKSKNPKLKFLLENVVMKKEYQAIISKYIGIEPIKINSALLSAQSRKRLYWTNIGTKRTNLFGSEEPGIPQPKDKGVYLKDILELDVDEKYLLKISKKGKIKNNQNKSSCFTAGGNSGGNHSDMDLLVIKCGRQVGRKIVNGKRNDEANIKPKQRIELRKDDKTGCLTTVQKDNLVIIQKPRGFNKGGLFETKSPTITSNSWEHNNHVYTNTKIRRLTPTECCRLQTIPNWAIEKILNCGVSDSQIYKMLGNGWTVDVIAYILSYLNK